MDTHNPKIVNDTYKKLPEYTEMFMRVKGMTENKASEAAFSLCELFAKWRAMK